MQDQFQEQFFTRLVGLASDSDNELLLNPAADNKCDALLTTSCWGKKVPVASAGAGGEL